MRARAPWVIAALLVLVPACQPQAGVVFTVLLPDGVLPSRALHVEPDATDAQGEPTEADRSEVAVTARGYVVEVAWFEPTVDATIEVWVDMDGDGQRGRGDLVGTLPRTHLAGQGCDGMDEVATPVTLAPIP